MTWSIEFLPDAERDLKKLDGAQKTRALKALEKVFENPLPQSEGGFGKPLGNKMGLDLSVLLKVKLKRDGIRIVYRLVRRDSKMCVVVVGMRADLEVYRMALSRRRKAGF